MDVVGTINQTLQASKTLDNIYTKFVILEKVVFS